MKAAHEEGWQSTTSTFASQPDIAALLTGTQALEQWAAQVTPCGRCRDSELVPRRSSLARTGMDFLGQQEESWEAMSQKLAEKVEWAINRRVAQSPTMSSTPSCCVNQGSEFIVDVEACIRVKWMQPREIDAELENVSGSPVVVLMTYMMNARQQPIVATLRSMRRGLEVPRRNTLDSWRSPTGRRWALWTTWRAHGLKRPRAGGPR